jgi:hypothetical protein
MSFVLESGIETAACCAAGSIRTADLLLPKHTGAQPENRLCIKQLPWWMLQLSRYQQN